MWGPHKEGSLQLLKIISSGQGGHCQLLWTSFSAYSYKAWKIISTTGPLPRSSYSWTHEMLCPENECPGRRQGWFEPLHTLITLNVVSCWDSQPRQPARLTPRRRGGVRIILEASNVLPFPGMESSSRRCQDKTWELQLYLRDMKEWFTVSWHKWRRTVQ